MVVGVLYRIYFLTYSRLINSQHFSRLGLSRYTSLHTGISYAQLKCHNSAHDFNISCLSSLGNPVLIGVQRRVYIPRCQSHHKDSKSHRLVMCCGCGSSQHHFYGPTMARGCTPGSIYPHRDRSDWCAIGTVHYTPIRLLRQRPKIFVQKIRGQLEHVTSIVFLRIWE